LTQHTIGSILAIVGGFGVGYVGGWRVFPWFILAMLGTALSRLSK
jgi:hypothetical protein